MPHAGERCRPSARWAPSPAGHPSHPALPELGPQSGSVFGPAVQRGRKEGRKDLWAPNLDQCGSGMSNGEVGLLPPSAGVSAPGNAL